MDPKECLIAADQAISDLNPARARECLSNYREWRIKGGFQPIEVDGKRHGDEFYRYCLQRFESMLLGFEVTYEVTADASIPIANCSPSLDAALEYARKEAQRIEESGEPCGEIFCTDSLGNSWILLEDNGLYMWEVGDDVRKQYPLGELRTPESAPTLSNRERFIEKLTAQYVELFELPAYAIAKARNTPRSLAEKMTAGLIEGTANKNGDGIKRTCKALGIKNTYAAIREYLS